MTEDGEPVVHLHTHIGKPGVILEVRPPEHADDPPSERDMDHLPDAVAADLHRDLGAYLYADDPRYVTEVRRLDGYGVTVSPLPPRHPGEPPMVEVESHHPVKQGYSEPRRWRYVFKIRDRTGMVTMDASGLHASLTYIYAPADDAPPAGPEGYATIAVNGGTPVPEFVRDALMDVMDLNGFGRPPYIHGRDEPFKGMDAEPEKVETVDGGGIDD